MKPRKDPNGNFLPTRLHRKHGAYYHVRESHGRTRWTRVGTTYPEALAGWARLEDATNNAQTVAQAIEAYLVHRGVELSPKTLKGYRSSQMRLNAVFGSCFLDGISRQEVRQWLHTRAARISANRDLALLRAVYHHAIEWGWCQSNPAAGVRRHRETPRRRVASRVEREALAAQATPLWRALVAVELLTGMREGEIRMLSRADLTEEGIRLHRPKTGTESLIEWTPALRDAVDAALRAPGRPSTYIFPSKRGGPYTENGFRTTWRRLCQKACIDGLEFRDLRRTAASDAGSLEAARDLLGHGSTAITKRVYRVANRVKPVA